MKKLLFLFLMCTSLSLVATAQEYEDIAKCLFTFDPSTNEQPRTAAFDGDYCYGLMRSGYLEVFDVSDVFTLTTFTTKAPVSSAPLYVSPGGWTAAVSGDYLYTTASAGGSVVDISTPTAPVQVGIFNTLYRCVNLVIVGNYMVGVEYSSSTPNDNAVEVWDISNPATPVSVSFATFLDQGWSVAVYGDYIYAASGWSAPALNIIDFKDPKNISLIKTIPLSGLPYHLKIVGDKLVLSESGLLRLYDLTDPLNPVQVDAQPAKGRVCAVDGTRIINFDTVHKVVGSTLQFVQNFDNHGIYGGDGFPFGSDVQYYGPDGMVGLAGNCNYGGTELYLVILRTLVPPQPLTADTKTIPEAGGSINFTLDAQNTYANRNYLILGSVSGTMPGTPLPGGMVLPLNWDILTNLCCNYLNTPIFENFLSTLDAAGQATAKFDTLGPIPGSAGIKLYFAFLLGPPGGFDFVSNYVEIEVVL